MATVMLNSCTSVQSETATEPQYIEAEDGGDIAQYFKQDWAKDKLWDDGLAEVNIYDAERTIYGKKRSFEYTYIVVKEVFNEEYDVKTDLYSRDDLYEVMKQNQFCKIETDNYPYHFMTSLFTLRNEPHRVKKATYSSQEWCGMTSKQFLFNGEQYEMSWSSYWDEQGIGEQIFPTNYILFDDQLAYTLRSLKFDEVKSFEHQVANSQISSKFSEIKMHNAQFEIDNSDEETYSVKVIFDENKESTYVFEKAYPNTLISMNTWDGRTLKLKGTSRYAYWQH